MLSIDFYDYNHNFRRLKNSPGLFHEALYYVLRGEKRFHVEGESNVLFDLVYEDNDVLMKGDSNFPNSDFFKSEILYPPYYSYDENNTEKIALDMLEGYEEIFFEEVNEYTAVIAELALKHTSMKVTFRDSRIFSLPWLASQVKMAATPEKDNALYVQQSFYEYFTDPNRVCTLDLFHSMFILQWVTDLPREKMRYLSYSVRKTEGIGSIFSCFSQMSQAFGPYGLEVFVEPGSTRFSQEMMTKYFRCGIAPKESTPENTAYVQCFNSIILNHFVQRYTPQIRLDMLNESFLHEMEEYANSVIGERKVLGALLRGTDIIIANYSNDFRPVELDDAVKAIRRRIDAFGYDKVFVATEDSAILERMMAEFPKKIIAVSQERHSVADFKGVKYISDLEKQIHTGNSYQASVEDTTVNYIYALYLLSRCDSFVANCRGSGVSLVLSFNDGAFKHSDILSSMNLTEEIL